MKIIVMILFAAASLIIGCSKSGKDSNNVQNQQNVAETTSNTTAIDSTIIRDANVNVSTLDVNKDGKVYQCPMHAEVISDKHGVCPLCKMYLQEVTVADASNNLK